MKKTLFITVLMLMAFAFAGCSQTQPEEQVAEEMAAPLAEPVVRDTEPEDLPEEAISEPIEKVQVDPLEEFDYQALLEDVSGGSASGKVSATFEDEYILYATFEDLPDLEEDFFYEGWVVRNNPLSVLSTGKAELVNKKYVNRFSAEGDLTDHTFYVLTLEPNDGDPAPAGHILEGTLAK
ncbi:hypothetical protein ACFL3C_04085 [Patescibacteria group bacterium]